MCCPELVRVRCCHRQPCVPVSVLGAQATRRESRLLVCSSSLCYEYKEAPVSTVAALAAAAASTAAASHTLVTAAVRIIFSFIEQSGPVIMEVSERAASAGEGVVCGTHA